VERAPTGCCLFDLAAAGEAVGNDERVGRRLANLRQLLEQLLLGDGAAGRLVVAVSVEQDLPT
jgi:hypothetical protein